MPYTLGIDSSTQSCSALVIDPEAGKLVAGCSINFGQSLPEYGAPQGFMPVQTDGEVHSSPLMWLDALELLLEDLKKQCDLSKIAAVSGAGQQHGSVYLNEKWFDRVRFLSTSASLASQLKSCLTRESAPIWMDGSTTEECREIAAAVGGNDVVCAKSGSIVIERFTGPQIRRFFKKNEAAYSDTARIHLVSSFLCSVMSGADAPIDRGDGAGMNLLNINNWSWDSDLLEATAPDLESKLPTVCPSSHICGTIAPYFVEKFGFSPKTPVTVFTGDNPSSLVGMGASRPGKIVISLGTSDTFFAAMPEVVSDPAGCGHVFGNPAGGSMSLQCFVNGSLAREAVKDRFSYDWEQFTRALSETPAGNRGHFMVPFFRPEISPRMDREEPILEGSEAFRNWQEPRAAIRACIEGQAINIKLCSQWMRLQPKTIYLTGGASENDAIAQVIADVFQARVQRLAVSSSVALGAAMRAANQSLALSISELESRFCQPVPGSTLEPKVHPDTYDTLIENFRARLMT